MTEEGEVIHGEIVPLGTIEAEGPLDIIERGTEIATALKNIIDKQRLYTEIRGKQFVRVEGWNTLGAMLGVMPREVEVKPFEDGWQATVELLRVTDGMVVGRGSAICTREESTWAERADYAVRSMAITRATGKAYRLGFSWIIALAGYEPTPAEEMAEESPKGNSRSNGPPANITEFKDFVVATLDHYKHAKHVDNAMKKLADGPLCDKAGNVLPSPEAMLQLLVDHAKAEAAKRE